MPACENHVIEEGLVPNTAHTSTHWRNCGGRPEGGGLERHLKEKRDAVGKSVHVDALLHALAPHTHSRLHYEGMPFQHSDIPCIVAACRMQYEDPKGRSKPCRGAVRSDETLQEHDRVWHRGLPWWVETSSGLSSFVMPSRRLYSPAHSIIHGETSQRERKSKRRVSNSSLMALPARAYP